MFDEYFYKSRRDSFDTFRLYYWTILLTVFLLEC